MNKGILKTTFREIKSSFGRYIAILLIIALGVGFYSGLKISYESMVYSADRYYAESNFYDYQLLSTLGFDEDAEKTFEHHGNRRISVFSSHRVQSQSYNQYSFGDY